MPQAISWWTNMYAHCRQTLGTGRDQTSGNSYVQNLHSIANIELRPIFKPFKPSSANVNPLFAKSKASNFLTAVTKKDESFQIFFLEQCCNHFFTLSGTHTEKIKYNFSNSNEIWRKDPIILCACTYYIVRCYIQLNHIEKKEAAKNFINTMQKLSRHMIEDKLDENSRVASDVDRSMMNSPSTIRLLEKINESIIALFGNTSGPCDETIEILLKSHIMPGSYNNHQEFFRHDDVKSNYIKSESVHLKNRRCSEDTIVFGERLISMIGIRTLNLCLNVVQPPHWERHNRITLLAGTSPTIVL